MEGICERIEALLKERGISGSRMSADLGMSRSFMTELRVASVPGKGTTVHMKRKIVRRGSPA